MQPYRSLEKLNEWCMLQKHYSAEDNRRAHRELSKEFSDLVLTNEMTFSIFVSSQFIFDAREIIWGWLNALSYVNYPGNSLYAMALGHD